MNIVLLDKKTADNCRENCNGFPCKLMLHFTELKKSDVIESTLGYANKEIYELAIKNKSSIKRKKLIPEVKNLLGEKEEFLFLNGRKKVLITAPHAAWHYRYTWGKNKRKLGDWIKLEDKNTGLLSCCIGRKLDIPVLIQVYTAWLDPNFYREAFFREKMREIMKTGIKFVIDIHGLSNEREADFDIVDLFGLSLIPFNKIKLRDCLKKRLEAEGYNIGVNRYFNGGLNLPFQHTIIKELSQEFSIPCIELEIGKKFRTVPREILDNKVLNILVDWIELDVLKLLK